MNEILNLAFITSVLTAAIGAGAALLYAALGESLAERSGIINLGVEGMMLMGALGGFAFCFWSGSAWFGLLGAVIAGSLMATIHAVVTITLHANQIVSGLALTLFGGGLSAYLGTSLVGQPAPDSFSRISIPLLHEIPIIGPILFQQNPLVYIAYVAVPAIWWFVYKTRPGLHLRAAGENPAAIDAMGLSVALLRYRFVIIGGALAGVGGAVISLATNPGWSENMTAGRGWIAVALVIFGMWNPSRVALGALLFGAVEAAQFRLQGVNIPISSFFLAMTPYIFTIVVLVFATQRARKHRIGQPAALGQTFAREDR